MGHSPFLGGRWDDIELMSGARDTGADIPSKVAYRGVQYLYELVPASTKALGGSREGTHFYQEGSAIVMHIHWKTNSTDATGGDIVWEYEYTISNPANGSAETYVAATQVTQTIPAGNRQHLANSFDIVTIPGTGLGVSFLFSWTLKRLGGAGGDNYPASVFPFSISLHHQMDTVGSNMQNSKN